jgi:hypothetical protein
MNWFSNSGDYAKLKEECFSPEGFPAESEVLFLDWNEDSYEGGFYMLFRRGSEIFEQQLSHCSCNYYGEDVGTWQRLPAVTADYLRMRQRPFYDDTPEKLVAWDAAVELAERS